MSKPLTRPTVAVGVVVLKDDRVLLIRRKNPPNAGHWSLPGGKQELGEGIRDTANREVFEETGITFSGLELLDALDSIHRNRDGSIDHHYTLVDFHARWTSGEPVAGDDAIEARWVPISEIDELGMWKETSRIIRQAHRLQNRGS